MVAALLRSKGGVSLDTSMGLTPLEGLVMGQRCGDLDPSIVGFLAEKLQVNSESVISVLNQKSGASRHFRHQWRYEAFD